MEVRWGLEAVSVSLSSPFFEIVLMLVRFDHVASVIVNVNHSVM
jgi:hypothetical protein